MTEAVFGVEPP